MFATYSNTPVTKSDRFTNISHKVALQQVSRNKSGSKFSSRKLNNYENRASVLQKL